MHSRLSFFLTALVISACSFPAFANADQPDPHFTLQVASFPDANQATKFAVGLVTVGENPVFDAVEIEGRGTWTRVLVGLFKTHDAARRHALALVSRGFIKEFVVKKVDQVLAFTRPRRIAAGESQLPKSSAGSGLIVTSKPASLAKLTGSGPIAIRRLASAVRSETERVEIGRDLDQRIHVGLRLPIIERPAFRLAPRFDTRLIPRPDPVDLAFRLVAGDGRHSSAAAGWRGGLWLSGDTAEGLARLQWIVGEENIGLIRLEADGRVKLDKRLLAKAAGLGLTHVEDPFRALNYVSSNEGLLLLVQIAQGHYRYLLHIGRQAPTSGKSVEMSGSINLDNNVDSRINPYRKNGKKLDSERPPQGFDSMIGLNPAARWFNLRANCWVQGGEIVFHEMAEAYAKLEFGVDYLDQGSRPGAHSLALERELRLKSQRPGVDIVMTTGSNRLLRSEEEIRLFYAEAAAGSNQR